MILNYPKVTVNYLILTVTLKVGMKSIHCRVKVHVLNLSVSFVYIMAIPLKAIEHIDYSYNERH